MIKKSFTRLVLILGITLPLLIALSILVLSMVLPQYDAERNLRQMREQNISYSEVYLEHGIYLIHAIQVGDPSKPKVLFIHGSPGYWTDWKKLLTNQDLLQEYCLISYDRPGYGKSEMPRQDLLYDQARAAASVMNHFSKGGERYILVGHSYGGGVAEQVVLDFPNMLERAILVSSTLSPKLQRLKWYNKVASGGLVRLVLPKDFITSNHEMLMLEYCLQQNETSLKNIDLPLTLIHGKKDVLVPFATVEYFRANKPEGVNYILRQNLNHFVPWSHPELIVNAILTTQ